MWNVRICGSIFGILLTVATASAKEVAGDVVSVQGIVFARPDDAKAVPKTAALKPGDVVYAGDVLNTSSDGAVKILLKDKTIIDLGPSALFKIESFQKNQGNNRQVELNMAYGRVRVAVTKKLEGQGKFHVKTRSATMGVRGTEFISNVTMPNDMKAFTSAGSAAKNSEGVTTTVLQGKVDVAPAGASASASNASFKPVSLTAGMQINTQALASSSGTAMAAPVKLNTSELSSVANSGKMADNTFVANVTVAPEKASDQRASESRSPASQGGGNGGNGGPAGGGASSAAMGDIAAKIAVAGPAPVMVLRPSEMPMPGAAQMTNSVSTNPNSNMGLRNVHVVVTVQ